MGWGEDDRIGVAFRRTPTGLDAAGRQGAYFVHALVWRSGQLPADVLAGLWGAAVWVLEPPDDPPARLSPLHTTADLGLGAQSHPAREAAIAALAAHLENLASRRRSLIALPDAEAYAHAAQLARALPRRYGLPAFSTFEAERRASQYHVLAGTTAPAAFSTIAPAVVSDRLWTDSATLLLEAADGDAAAAGVVDALADGEKGAGAFAAALRRWVVVDTQTDAAQPDLAAVARSASDPRLARRLLERNARAVARAVAAGHRPEAVMHAAAVAGSTRLLTDALASELARERPDGAMAVLRRVDGALGEGAPPLAAELARTWETDGRLADLRPTDAVALLELLAEAPVPSVVEQLVSSRRHAPAVVGEARLPWEWRGRAAAACPHELSPRRLAEKLKVSSRFADGFMRAPGLAALDALREALASVPATLAYDALEAVDRFLRRAEREEFALPVIRRLDPHSRLRALARYAPDEADGIEEWSDAALDALVDVVLSSRSQGTTLPALTRLQLPRGHSLRARTWGQIAGALSKGPGRVGNSVATPELVRAVRAAADLERARDANAALELIVDSAADSFVGRSHERTDALRAAQEASAEPARDFALRVARAAWRSGARDRHEMALWTILWVARMIEAKQLAVRDVDRAPFDRLHERLRGLDAADLERAAKDAPRLGGARRWLKDNARAVSRA